MLLRRLIASLFVVALLVGIPKAAFSAQGTGCMPTTGTVSGLTFAQDVNAAIAALISSNSGASAPATDCTAVAIKGQVWLDTSATPNILKQYDGASWVVLGYLDGTNHIWTPPVGGGAATLSSATTTDLWSVPQSAITISGTTTIAALANASAVPGTMKIVKFAGALTLTYNSSSLVLPTAANITTTAGDYALVVALTSTNVAVISYTKADGTALTLFGSLSGQLVLSSSITPSALSSGNNNNYAPSGLSGASILRLAANAAGSTITGLTGGTDGRIVHMRNVGTAPITIANESSSSTASNRFTLSSSIVLLPFQEFSFTYDGSTTRWYFNGARTCQWNQTLNFTSSSTYTAPNNLCWVDAVAVGGGGAGGPAGATSGSTQSLGGGGGGGACARGDFSAATIGASQTVTVGAGGSGAAGANGGTSSFGSLLVATGGTAGSVSTSGTGTQIPGVPGGTASGGSDNIPGAPGSSAAFVFNSFAVFSSGGGSCMSGGATSVNGFNVNGTAGTGYGAGASGSANGASQPQRNSGDGGPGLVQVKEFTYQ